jgi:hypothetical protein
LTHRYAEAWTIPHRTSSHSRFVNEADARRSGSTALTTAISARTKSFANFAQTEFSEVPQLLTLRSGALTDLADIRIPPTGVCCDRYPKFPTSEPRESPVPNAEGDAESFGGQEGESFPLDESYCKWVLEGRIPDVVPDARLEDATKDPRVTLSCSPMLAYSLFQWGGKREYSAPREDRSGSPGD